MIDMILKLFEIISHLTVGDFRNWLLSDTTTVELIKQVKKWNNSCQVAAAVSKIAEKSRFNNSSKNVQ